MEFPESSPPVSTDPSSLPIPNHGPPFIDNPRTPPLRPESELEPESSGERIHEPNQNVSPPFQTSRPPPPPPPPAGIVGPYWAAFEEDLSEPLGNELKEIEAATGVYSARDFDHWERLFYSELDDPDYRPVEKARLSWTFKGVRGNKNHPNRARIMRSPPAYVGGYWWSIKFLPRGNAVADLSLYVECSPNMPTPDKHLPETEFKVLRGSPQADLAGSTPDLDFKFAETDDSSENWVNDFRSRYSAASFERQEPPDTHGPTSRDWRVSAQLGVVMYNPQEPRTCSVDSVSHQFNSYDADWGWTNFHGPWDRIHLRQKGQRQAMLRNDTLAFDVYIRVIDDPTLLLWWHPTDSQPNWDGPNVTGYWPLRDCVFDNGPEVASLAAWINLAPFRKIILDVDVLEHLTHFESRPKPICGTLQWIYWQTGFDENDCRYLGTANFSSRMRHMRELSDSATECWERLRRALDLELAGTDAVRYLASLFDSPSLSSSPSHSGTQGSIINAIPREYNSRIRIHVNEFKSIQAGLTQYLGSRQGRWALPPLLNVELYRHILDKTSRQWCLLYDRVDLDEEVDLTPQVVDGQCGRYVLYGYVGHRGRRTSGKFFSVLRPGGPGTKWLGFDDDEYFNVRYLTRKMALGTHAGLDSSQLKHIDENVGHDVATAVFYVRADVVNEFLPGPQAPCDFPPAMQKYCRQYSGDFNQLPPDQTTHANIQVEVYSMPHCDQTSGLFSAYDLLSQARATNHVMYLKAPRSSTLAELRRNIAVSNSEGSEQPIQVDQIRLWYIQNLNWQCGFSVFDRVTNLHDTLSTRQSNNVRLWMELVSESDAKYFSMPDPPPKVATLDGKSEGAVTERDGFEDSSDRRSANEELDDSRTNPSENTAQSLPASNDAAPVQPQSAGTTIANDSTIENLDPFHEQVVDSEQLPLSRAQSILPQTIFTEDQTRNDPFMSSVAVTNRDEAAVSDVPEEPQLNLPVPHALCFIQVFDAENQTLRTIGSFLCRTEENVKSGVLERLGWPEDKDVRVWDTLPSGICSEFDISGYPFQESDGIVLVVGDRLDKETCGRLSEAGLFNGPKPFTAYLLAESRKHPFHAFTGTRTSEPSFTSAYYSGQFVKGYYHGTGTHISNLGNIYVGDFVFGNRHGKGRIEYASGDVYDGDWINGEPHGQGTFIEKRTGNKYVGGYANGKRRGKGITYWEVADEEMDMCQICYGEAQDALFYDCGHLCACMECAEQVDVCPICRKDIINVVRVFRI